jgi:S1-C subfamily serine protease
MQRGLRTFLREFPSSSHFPRLFHTTTPTLRPSITSSRSALLPFRSHTAHIPRIALLAQAQRNTSTLHSMDGQQNGESRVKRKEHPSSSQDRPLKQLRSDATAEEPANGFDQDDEVDAQPVMHAATTDSVEWQRTIETVVSKVVSIHFCQTSAFDTDPALSSEATGFVVDAENGYILTNRVSWSATHGLPPS